MQLQRSPCEMYIKFLILRPEGLDDRSIISLLDEEGLDPIGSYYLRALREDLSVPDPFYPEDHRHTESRKFLRKEQVYSMFFQDEDMRFALKALRSPRAKDFIENALICRSKRAVIARHVAKKWVPYFTPAAVKKYAHYFWNIDNVTRAQLDAIVQLRDVACMRGVTEGNPEYSERKLQAEALRRASYRDPKRALLATPLDGVQRQIAKLGLGVPLSAQDDDFLLSQLKSVLILRSLEAAHTNPADMHIKVRDWISTVETIGKARERTADPTKEIRGELARVLMKHDTKKVPLLSVISGGRHTAELEKKKDDEDE